MNTIYYDFETFYDSEYSLRKMPPAVYIRDPRFKVLGCSIAINDEPAKWYPEESWLDFATKNQHALWVCFNGLFDPLILTHHYGIYPSRYGDSLALARYALDLKSYALKNVSKALGLQAKGDLDQSLQNGTLDTYANTDTELCRSIYKRIAPHIPQSELDMISLTTRWFAEPTWELDIPLLESYLISQKEERQRLIDASGVHESILASNDKFEAHIKSLGLVPPIKVSKTTGEDTNAFAKNDPEFILFKAKYPEYEALWAARQAAKSTIHITRTEHFINHKTTLPAPLNYWGAHTGRFSGSGKINVQNLPRKSTLRKALKAPKGHVILAVDAAQIELRLNFWFCGQYDLLNLMAENKDLYIHSAATHFQIPEDQVSDDQRQFGKICELGLGYRMGAKRFQEFCASGPLGMPPLYITDVESYTTIQNYRATHFAVSGMWHQLDDVIQGIAITKKPFKFKCLEIHKGGILLPNGTFLQYPKLQQNEQGSWVYGNEVSKFIHGGLLLENIIQALSRVLIVDNMLEVERCGIKTISSTHDEIIACVPESEAQAANDTIVNIMSTRPKWALDLPLGAKGSFGPTYGHCK